MDDIIKHIINVGTGNIKTNRKGKVEWLQNTTHEQIQRNKHNHV